jgi:hypothetical protein
VGGARGNIYIKSGPEEKAMKDTNKLAESSSARIFARARQIVVGVTLLLALTLTGPPRLWGQCPGGPAPTGLSVSVSPGNVIGNSQTVVTATITLNAVVPQGTGVIGLAIDGVATGIITPLYYGQALVACGHSTATVNFYV